MSAISQARLRAVHAFSLFLLRNAACRDFVIHPGETFLTRPLCEINRYPEKTNNLTVHDPLSHLVANMSGCDGLSSLSDTVL